MKHLKTILAATVLTATCIQAQAQDDQQRFKRIPVTEMSPAQKQYFDALMAGPVSGTGSAAVVQGATSRGAPFHGSMRSPVLAHSFRTPGEYLRFNSSIPFRLNEFAILITARQWTSQYEWFAHHRLALQAGLSPEVAAAVADGKRPTGMKEDEEIVYNFCHELHTQKKVSDASYKAVVDKFGEQGVMDLIAVNGYYVLVSMVLNVDRTPIPGGGALPLKDLK